jgi:hypothetical protein
VRRLGTQLLALALSATALAKPAPEAAVYLQELERRGLADKTAVSAEKLAAEVRAADDDLVAGQPGAAAARLYAIVEGPRYQDFSDSEDFQDAEYRLGLAMARGGGSTTARRYLLRALARGAQAPFYHAALRAYVDVCLDERVVSECVRAAEQLTDVGEELAYLRGRGAYDGDHFSDAEAELARVTPKSRFYSSALYLRGVMRVKRGDLRSAEDAFCTIADVKEGDRIRFYIDGRFYALKDLARLALGRIAHEQGRDDDAFYHYFLIPQDSKKLPDALFEAAWATLAGKQYDLGARLADELLKQYPDTPRASEARLLRATLQVKTCRFAEAERGFDAALAEYEPLTRAVDRAINDGATRRALAQRLLALSPQAEAHDETGVIAAMLQVDARFYRLQAIARGLAQESADAGHVVDTWRALVERLSATKVQPVGSSAPTAAALLESVNALGRELARSRPSAEIAALEARRVRLAETLERVLDLERGGLVEDKGLQALMRSDRAAAERLRGRAAMLQARIDAASGELIRRALIDLRGRLEQMLRQARLGKIDAVVGQKRKLERQIEDLAAGRFPPEMFGKLHIEGLIGDDEEYWPPEVERWADEYEGYK